MGRAASALHPVPPESERITRERALRAAAESEGEPLVDRYFRKHPELRRVDPAEDPYNQTRWDVIAREVDRQLQPALEEPRVRVREQIRFVDRLQWASPSISIKSLLDDLSGNSLSHYLDFASIADRFHDIYIDYLHPKMLSREKLTLADYDRFPRFDDGGLGDRPHVGRVFGNLVCLTGWTLTVAAGAIFRLRKPMATA